MLITIKQICRAINIAVQVESRKCFHGDDERDGVVAFLIFARIAHSKAQSAGEASEISVNGVGLFFHPIIPCFKMMVDACAPVFVQAIINAGVVRVIPSSPVGWFVAYENISNLKAPSLRLPLLHYFDSASLSLS